MKYGKLKCAAIFLCLAVQAAWTSSVRAEQLTNVTASASSFYNSTVLPIFAVNGAGLYGIAHTNIYLNVVWQSKAASPIDGEYFIIDLKKNYRLDPTNTLRAWNCNVLSGTDIGIRAATFSYSLDSLTFTDIAGVTTDSTNFPTTTFDQATGLATYSNYNTVNFNASLTARYIKIRVNGGQGVGNYGYPGVVGLSEVQAFGAFVSDPTNFLGAQITVSNATASSGYAPPYGNATNLINSSGLTGLRHDTASTSMWFAADGVTNVTIDFDLGMPKNLGAVRIWNCNQPTVPYDGTRKGMRMLDILVSDDPTFTTGVITNYNDIELLIAPAENGVYDNPQIIDMKRVSGRYVRLSTVGNSNPNWGGNYTALSEAQFFQAVPVARGTMFTFQ